MTREAARPLVHYTPRRNWMNDPNGLIRHRGVWHLFYQHNPHDTVWGHMSWGHATSTDLLLWQEHGVAIAEDGHGAVFSGSVVFDREGRAGFGTGALVAIYTGHVEGPPRRQTQNLAVSIDHGATWTRFGGNPVLDFHLSEFRDPKVLWHAPTGRWIMAVALPERRQVAFFASPNLRTWQELSRFGPAGTPGRVWECPDLILLDDGAGTTRWLLKVDVFEGASAGGSGALAFLGDFDGCRFRPDREPAGEAAWQWVDHGRDFYAAASWGGLEDGRVVWIAWMGSHHYATSMPDHGWRGAMTIPRELGLIEREGRLALTQSPVREWRARARRVLVVCARASRAQRLDLDAVAFEVALRFGGAQRAGFRLALSRDDGGTVTIAYEAASSRLTIDRVGAGQLPDAPHFSGGVGVLLRSIEDVRVLVDVGSVELFADEGTVAITEQLLGTAPFRQLDLATDDGDAWLELFECAV